MCCILTDPGLESLSRFLLALRSFSSVIVCIVIPQFIVRSQSSVGNSGRVKGHYWRTNDLNIESLVLHLNCLFSDLSIIMYIVYGAVTGVMFYVSIR